MEYRYMIWNDFKKEFQFPRICETTEKELILAYSIILEMMQENIDSK